MLNPKILFSGPFILASLLAISACDQTKRYTDQEFVQRAKDFQAQGQLESAVIELKNAAKNPRILKRGCGWGKSIPKWPGRTGRTGTGAQRVGNRRRGAESPDGSSTSVVDTLRPAIRKSTRS
jgi:hypothetical protein